MNKPDRIEEGEEGYPSVEGAGSLWAIGKKPLHRGNISVLTKPPAASIRLLCS
jgi:hypothetical protein